MPTYTIAHNAGVEGAVVVGKLLEQTNLNIGYDAAKGMWTLIDENVNWSSFMYCAKHVLLSLS